MGGGLRNSLGLVNGGRRIEVNPLVRDVVNYSKPMLRYNQPIFAFCTAANPNNNSDNNKN